MANVTARSVFRSATASARTAATRLATGAKPKTSVSPFRIPTQKPLTARFFRSPLELSCVRIETMLPYHTTTAYLRGFAASLKGRLWSLRCRPVTTAEAEAWVAVAVAVVVAGMALKRK
nr:protein NUCLEAR FUSION DEFECTIVE 6, chloroplastic/mitochondrial-like isoform X1 [Ipomoea batatas]